MARIEGTPDAESLSGGDGNDTILGFAGRDTLDGGLGNDRIFGGGGGDLIRSGDGFDKAWGGSGADTLRGGTGNHTLSGDGGDDWILLGIDDSYWSSFDPPQHRVGYGGGGDDLLQTTARHHADLFGGEGTDTVRFVRYSSDAGWMRVALSGPDAGVTGSDGQRVLFDSIERLQFFADFGDQSVTGGALDDQIHVGAGRDLVLAGEGDDTVGMRLAGAHTLDGGTGNDLLMAEGLENQSIYFIVDQQDGTVDDGHLSLISGFERYEVLAFGGAADVVSLGAGDDIVASSAGDDTVFGMAGNDRLTSRRGADLLDGGDGNDTLIGGRDGDTLFGGDGDDRIFLFDADVASGGAGADRFAVKGGFGALITDFEVGVDRLVLSAADLAGFSGPTGRQAEQMIALGAAVSDGGQFLLTHDALADRMLLWWDRDGALGEAAMDLILSFDGSAIPIDHRDLFVV